MNAAPIALRVVGSTANRREVVSHRKAILAYSCADPAVRLDVPTFLSAFCYPRAIEAHVKATGSTAGYSGPVAAPTLNFDLDRDDLDLALDAAKRLAWFLVDRFKVEPVVGFSGSKGFHLELPLGDLAGPAEDTHLIAKRLACRLADQARVVIDVGVYDKLRLWRAWNSRHPKTGLHKVRIDLDDLLHLNAEAVRRLAVEPIAFDLPEPPSACPRLIDDWAEVAALVRRERAALLTSTSTAAVAGRPRGRINPTTLGLIRDPTAIGVGDRHRTVFSAAADLAEFATIDDLIAALLTEPALDTGLPPREVERQIRTGIDHARRKHAEGGTRGA